MDSPKAQDPTTTVPDNKRDPLLGGRNSIEIGGVWTLKNDISSPKFYELLFKTGLKGGTALYLNKFCNQINMCLNAVTRLREDLLPDYQYTKIHIEFEK